MSAVVTPMVKLDSEGVLERCFLPSKTTEGVTYEMVRLIGGRWAHTDAKCRGWVERGSCYHIAALEGLAMSNEANEESRAITIGVNKLALIDDVDLQKVMSSKLIASERHIYSFRVKGQLVEGVSIDGVRDAVRALSTQGEAVREMDVRLDHETERDAYFVAKAGRYAISPDGQEILMDTCIRAKRQPKWGKKADGSGEFFIDAWYEIGVAKAVRNATEALLPEALKDFIKAEAKKLMQGGQNGNGRPQPSAVPQRTAPSQAPASPAAQNNPRRDVALLLAEMQSTVDAEFQARAYDALRREFPEAFPGGTRYLANKLSEDDARGLAARMRTALTGDGPPADDAPAPSDGEQGALDA